MMHNAFLHSAAGSAQSHPSSPLPSPDAAFNLAQPLAQLPHQRSYSAADVDLPYRFSQHLPLPPLPPSVPLLPDPASNAAAILEDASSATSRGPGVSPRRPDHFRARSRSLLSAAHSHPRSAAGDSEGESSDDKEQQRALPSGLVVDEGVSAGGGADESSVIKRRSRTLTTPLQQRRLQQVLEQTRFPSTELREQLAKELGMTPRRVQIWFQNRRQGIKKARDQRAEQESSMAAATTSVAPPLPYPYHSYPTTPSVGFCSSTHDTSAAQDPAYFTVYPNSTAAGPVNLDLLAHHSFVELPPPLTRPLTNPMSLASLPSTSTHHHPSLDFHAPFHHSQIRHQHHPSTTSLSTLSESDASHHGSTHGWSCASSVTSASQPESVWIGGTPGGPSQFCPLPPPATTQPQPATWMSTHPQAHPPSNLSPVLSRIPAGRSRSLTNPEHIMMKNKHRMGSLPNGTILEENGPTQVVPPPLPALSSCQPQQQVGASGHYGTGLPLPLQQQQQQQQFSQSALGLTMGRSRSSTDAVLSEGLLRFRFERSCAQGNGGDLPHQQQQQSLAPASVDAVVSSGGGARVASPELAAAVTSAPVGGVMATSPTPILPA